MHRITLIGLLILVIITGIFFWKNFSQKGNSAKTLSPLISNVSSPTPSPIPFEELTIPYLRNKEYEGSLGQLQKVSENQSYTSYLTSFTSDGLKINGLLTQPKGEKVEGGFPAIVFIHGYIPPTQYNTLEKYIDHVDLLARNGFVVFKIDLRGHGNSEGESTGAYFSSDYIVDTLNAYVALQSSGFVNPKKIGLWGHSMAGNIVLKSYAAKTDIPAVVIWSGAGYTYIDLNEYGISDASYQPPIVSTERARRRQKLRELYGEPNEGNPFWKTVIPTNYLNDLKGVIQLNHAINDDVVSIEYSRNLDNLLNKTNVIHQINEYPSGGHNISGVEFAQAMQNTVDFFKKYLK